MTMICKIRQMLRALGACRKARSIITVEHIDGMGPNSMRMTLHVRDGWRMRPKAAVLCNVADRISIRKAAIYLSRKIEEK